MHDCFHALIVQPTLYSQQPPQPEFQPGGDEWIVLTDPEGHPFCLML